MADQLKSVKEEQIFKKRSVLFIYLEILINVIQAWNFYLIS